jgi:DNA invertase Pin-like site-specific DNA recombinase
MPTAASPAGIAAIYVRLSQDREGAGLAVARQEADCRLIAERRGYGPDHIRVYSDNDLSAYNGKLRPAYRDMLRDIESGDVSLVVAWHGDRLHRSVKELVAFADLVQPRNVVVETARGGVMDFDSPTGRLVMLNLGVVARYESEHKAERHLSAEQELAKAGKAHGGRRPFGFEADRITIRSDEAALIREAVQRVLAGESVRAVAKDFDRRGVKTPDVVRNGEVTKPGQPWSISQLRKLLLSRRIAGRREHLGKDVARAEWTAIISTEDSDRLRAVLVRPNLRGTGTGNRPTRYLLAGIAVCALCGARLIARPANGRRSYACVNEPRIGGCGRLRVVAIPLEDLVVETLFQAVEGGALVTLLDTEADLSGTAGTLASEVKAIDVKLATLADKWSSNELTDGEWTRARENLAEKRAGLINELATLQRRLPVSALPDPLRAAWASLDFSQRRSIIEAFIERVVVTSARHGMPKFDPRRVTDIKWRA